MRVALIAPPFIPVPPKIYGGTELFVAELAKGLKDLGIEPIVYANGESTIDVEVRSIYEESEWPLNGDIFSSLKDLNHTAWAVQDAVRYCDVLHLNNAPGLTCSRFITKPMVYTLHHAKEQELSDFYSFYPEVEFVTISDFQRSRETMPLMRTIHHGIDLTLYECKERKQEFFSFLGRLAPVKGPHLAIEVAKRTGIPLKIAGEVQPLFKDYFERMVKPHLDGKFIEYVGEANLTAKNELLGNSKALLFPIQWDEPFGFVLIEAMACGTPVLALPGGSVAEIVREGVSGHICENIDTMVERARDLNIPAKVSRRYVEKSFATEVMARKYKELYEELLAPQLSPAQELAEPESAAA